MIERTGLMKFLFNKVKQNKFVFLEDFYANPLCFKYKFNSS